MRDLSNGMRWCTGFAWYRIGISEDCNKVRGLSNGVRWCTGFAWYRIGISEDCNKPGVTTYGEFVE